jgi:hypothetical protein
MEVLLDSNILIYSASPSAEILQNWLSENSLYISDITLLEVLGYHRLSKSDLEYFENFISYCNQISISPDIIKKAISLRQSKAMSLGDSLIASSALVFKIPLVTLNIKDFKHISNLELIEPVGYKF